MSKHVKHAVVSSNEFGFPGESAIISLGVSNLIDGTNDTFPISNIVEGKL